MVMSKEELFPGVAIYRNAVKDIDTLFDLMKKLEYIDIGGPRDVGLSFIKEGSEDENIIHIEKILESSISNHLDEYCDKYGIRGIMPEQWQLVRYGQGQKFATHLDEDCENPRTVSIIMYLNDDYSGGDLEYIWFDKIYKPKAGDLLIFPSNYIYSHRVNEVTSGTRYAVVRFYKWETLKNVSNLRVY
jgi:Rps23 Pro-64 3,4-dihydroxylase Tpa1-like proline 4-hydroxylase